MDYLVAAEAGQTLAASVRSDDPATLHIYGLDDGEQLAALSERRRLWAGTLPGLAGLRHQRRAGRRGRQYELTVTLR